MLALTLQAKAHDAARLAPLQEAGISDGRTVVVTVAGRTVYTFDLDAPGVSNCYDGCAAIWPPILVQDASALKSPMGSTKRKDGSLQLTFENKPVYLFLNDTRNGDAKGDGLNKIWHVIVD